MKLNSGKDGVVANGVLDDVKGCEEPAGYKNFYLIRPSTSGGPEILHATAIMLQPIYGRFSQVAESHI